MNSPDVVIVGAGITGCATAFELSKSGLKIQVIEKYKPGAMASGWTLAGVRQSGRHSAEIPLAKYSVEKWPNLAEILGGSTGYTQNGNLRLARTIEEEKIIDVGNEEFIDSEEWKDNFLKQGKWLRLLFMVVFSFVYYASMTVLWIIVLLQFLFVLFTSIYLLIQM